MKIAITGSTGLVGTALTKRLTGAGHTVIPIVRHRDRAGIYWDPIGGIIESGLETVDAVVHLAGAPIAEGGWNKAHRERIRSSRILGTQTLAKALVDLPPKVFISTSAIGFYGSREDEKLDETSRSGDGFLAEVCEKWERATLPIADAGWRVAVVRVGLVLSTHGGLLSPMLPLFRLGLGGRLASGTQWMSWVHLDDLTALYEFLLLNEVSGTFNGTAPNPVTNAEFTRGLAAALSRPAVFPVPGFVLRAVLGTDKTNELLLASQRVHPQRAEEAGFVFGAPTLKRALAIEFE